MAARLHLACLAVQTTPPMVDHFLSSDGILRTILLYSCCLPTRKASVLYLYVCDRAVTLTIWSAESRRLLIAILLSEYHEACRDICGQFLQRVSLLTSTAHHWVLQLLSDSMAEAESKAHFCSGYFKQFARVIQAWPQQSPEVCTLPVAMSASCGTMCVSAMPSVLLTKQML